MTDTTWTSAPAGVLGRGSAAVRAYPGVVVCPTPGGGAGTGLPVGGAFASVHPVGAGVRMRPLDGAFALPVRALEPVRKQTITRDDSITLGFPTPRRPQS